MSLSSMVATLSSSSSRELVIVQEKITSRCWGSDGALLPSVRRCRGERRELIIFIRGVLRWMSFIRYWEDIAARRGNWTEGVDAGKGVLYVIHGKYNFRGVR